MITTHPLKPVADLSDAELDREISERMGWRYDNSDPDCSAWIAPCTDPADAWCLQQWLLAHKYSIEQYPTPDGGRTSVRRFLDDAQKVQGTNGAALVRAALLALRAQEETR